MIRLYRLGLGWLVGRMILLLTTTGRKTGLPRTTPLQYEKVGDCYVLGSARGMKADWVHNLQANPRCTVEIGKHSISGKAELILDAEQICDFLELKLKRHPLMVGAILRSDGLPSRPSRSALLEYARKLVMVRIQPDQLI